MRRSAHVSSLLRALRCVVVTCAVVGYVVALGGTSAGQGWRLAPHLAAAHAGAPPPALVEGAMDGVVLPTLRLREHTHGGVAHHHADDGAQEVAPQGAVTHRDVRDMTADTGLHRHGDWVHDHRPPPPRREAPVVTLDKHQLPAPSLVPAPLAARVEAMQANETRGTRSLTVETPPPVGRG